MVKKCDVCGKELNIPPFKANRFTACEDCRNLHPEKVAQRKREIAAEKRAEKEKYWEDLDEAAKERRRAAYKKYYERHKTERKAYYRKHYQDNKAVRQAYYREYYRKKKKGAKS